MFATISTAFIPARRAKRSAVWLLGASLMMAGALSSEATSPLGRRQRSIGVVEHVVVHGAALEGNLEGDTADRQVSVYLPANYRTQPGRRYPVVYLLHGFQETDANWYSDPTLPVHVPTIMNRVVAAGSAKEMIIVTPNAMTVYGGSNYSSGATTGDWERFVARDLVAFIDSHYRTIRRASSRGLAGHSMGGYGAMRIGMKHPDIFSTLYFMSPCCVSAESNIPKTPDAIARFEATKAPPADFRTIPQDIRSAVAAAASWAPNPKKPPLYYDSPVEGGVRQDSVIARMTTNRPLEMVDQYIGSLRTQTIAFDVGNRDPNIANNMRRLDTVLSEYGVRHRFEVYDGTHTSEVAKRMEEKVFPFFSEHLDFNNR